MTKIKFPSNARPEDTKTFHLKHIKPRELRNFIKDGESKGWRLMALTSTRAHFTYVKNQMPN
jgi:hypothetical protein